MNHTFDRLCKKINSIYEKNSKWLERYLFPIILLLYPLIKINQGIDVSDSTYSLGNYLFFDRMEGMWVISTYLSNALGALLMRLPGGNSLLIMNLYTGLFVSLTAILCYFAFKKTLGAKETFLGEILAIGFCWIPTGILYNYMTYLFFTIGAILIYKSFLQGKKYYLFLAGVMLGVSITVRFPNITQAALILSVWFGCYLYDKKDWIKNTLLCIVGYVTGFAIPLAVISVQYGVNAYPDMIWSLMNISNSDETYSSFSMVKSVIDAYIRSGKWMLIIGMGLLLGTLMFSFYKGKLEWLKKVIYLCGIALILRFFWGRGMFSFRYYEDYSSMFEWGMVFLYFAWFGILNSREKETKLLASIVGVILLITPLGSNNYTLQNLNNLFIVAPFTVYMMGILIKKDYKNTAKQFPIRSMAVILMIVITIQSIGFHTSFVFRDGMRGEKRDTKMDISTSTKGMYTNAENAFVLNDLTTYLTNENLIGKEALFFGDAPGLSYILSMPFAISTSWPDLDSYPIEDFKTELEGLETTTIIIKNTNPATKLATQKKAYLNNYIKENNYQIVHENDLYQVYKNQ